MSEDIFYFPPFHPSCRCTIVAVANDGSVTEQQYTGVPSQGGAPQRFEDIFTNTDFFTSSLDGNVVGTVKEVLTEIDRDMSALSANALREARLRLGTISYDEGSISAGTEKALAWSFDDGTSITLNTNYFGKGNMARLLEAVDNNSRNGIFLRSVAELSEVEKIKYVIAHEYGHIVYAHLPDDVKSAYAAHYNTMRANEEANGSLFGSAVAMQDANEGFAEAFAGTFSKVQMSPNLSSLCDFVFSRVGKQ